MRLAKISSCYTLFIAVISLTCIFMLQCYELIYDISLALFGSAFLAFLIAFIEYSIEKKKALQKLYITAYEIIEKLSFIRYYHIDDNTKAHIESVKTNKSSGTLIDDYNYFKNDSSLAECIDSYIMFRSFINDDLQNSYAELDFFIGNLFIKKWIKVHIYEPLHDITTLIRDKDNWFQINRTSGDLINCLDDVITLNNKFFYTEYDENGGYTVYNETYSQLRNNIEKFRCKIYNQKYRHSDKYIVRLMKYYNIRY